MTENIIIFEKLSTKMSTHLTLKSNVFNELKQKPFLIN